MNCGSLPSLHAGLQCVDNAAAGKPTRFLHTRRLRPDQALNRLLECRTFRKIHHLLSVREASAMPVLMPEPQNTLLGKSTVYADTLDASLVQPIARSLGRDAIGAHGFRGTDIWRLYELSWLDQQGLPKTAVAELCVPATTRSIVESKSLKLFAGSFAMTRFRSNEEVAEALKDTLSNALDGDVAVRILPLSRLHHELDEMPGISLDGLTLAAGDEIVDYEVNPDCLTTAEGGAVEETLSTTLFRSLCPVTGQPDMAAVTVSYRGRPIDRIGLLKYLVSYRRHKGFHEQCVEQIFHDIEVRTKPDMLEVYACFTRRGGIDINPFRSSYRDMPEQILREVRQ